MTCGAACELHDRMAPEPPERGFHIAGIRDDVRPVVLGMSGQSEDNAHQLHAGVDAELGQGFLRRVWYGLLPGSPLVPGRALNRCDR